MRCLGVDRKEREDEGDGDKSNNGEEINQNWKKQKLKNSREDEIIKGARND